MKNEQRQQAQSLYLQSGLTKTQIAEHLNVSRRTVYQWSLEGSWDKLRKSAQHMPAILAEKCYYLIGHFTDHLLSAETMDMPITRKEVDMLHKLTVTVNKLKQGSTVSEAMQTFTLLLARIQCHDPKLAELVAPYIQSFVHDRRKLSETDFLLNGFNEDGYIDHSEADKTETELDKLDLAELLAQKNGETLAKKETPAPPQATTLKPESKQQAQSALKQTNSTPAPTQKTATPTPQAKQTLKPAKNKFASFRDRNKSLYSSHPRPSFSASKDILSFEESHSCSSTPPVSAPQTRYPLVEAA